MDPSARPGATQSLKNWSNDEDTGSHTIKIVGHISRPVVGEGRQTSDRQMYFVNSRPCTLPQVSKAFNEVYKTFNNNQSPFIFADIKLDTNAYDVNVSPDKRTIMLHDQAALLEKLKESLLSLFDDHDQSVPQSQLGGQKVIIPSLKPTPSRLRASSNVELSDNSEGSEGEDTGPSHSRPSRSIEQQRSGLSDNAALPGFVKASLIERFASRNSEERQDVQASNRRGTLSEERIAVAAQNASGEAEEENDRNGSSPASRRKSSPLPPSPKPSAIPPVPMFTQPSKPVQDFNARVANAQVQINEPQDVFHVAQTEDEKEEESIPAIVQTPQKSLTQSSIQNAFDRMRPLRTPMQNATITIGDTTSVSTIGSGFESASARRSRIHTPKFSLSGKPLDVTPKRSLFSKTLSGFAAPGTQLDSSDQDEEDEMDGEPSRQQPIESDTSMHSPPPSKRRCVRLSSAVGSDEDVVEDTGRESPRADSEGPSEEEAGPIADPEEDAGPDEEYIDDSAKKAQEEARIAKMIAEAEEAAARPTELNLKRANKLFKASRKKYSTLNMERVLTTSAEAIASLTAKLQRSSEVGKENGKDELAFPSSTQLNTEDPEERLSLTVTKQDFNEMQIIGQFNLGFIIAVRPPTSTSPTSDLFIIDQHASDEKYNFERLSATTHLVSQRLVHPHPLDLTAVETEIIAANSRALTANGFVVDLDSDSSTTDGSHRARLTSLPMSKEVTFTPTDLEELLALILDDPPSASPSTSLHIPRPSKVRKLLASRACRSSVMIGKTLKTARMREIVQHMGSMDKPWSCPHGRPTMRHLYALEKWSGWTEVDGVVGVEARAEERVDWGAFVGKYKV
jgi:DNA mismatch repair protein PMS2